MGGLWRRQLLPLLVAIILCWECTDAQCIDSRAGNYDPAATVQGSNTCLYGVDGSAAAIPCDIDPIATEQCGGEQVASADDRNAIGSNLCQWRDDVCQPAGCSLDPLLGNFVLDSPDRIAGVPPRLTILRYDFQLSSSGDSGTRCCADDGCCASCCAPPRCRQSTASRASCARGAASM